MLTTGTAIAAAARLGLNGTYLTLAALVALAVGNELVIAHPDGDGPPALSLLLFGGALLYVASQAWYLSWPRARPPPRAGPPVPPSPPPAAPPPACPGSPALGSC